MALTWNRTIPLISADEIGYLGNAQALVTGTGPNMRDTTFYFAGFSLLLAPIA